MAVVASMKGKAGGLADFQRHIRRDLAVRPTPNAVDAKNLRAIVQVPTKIVAAINRLRP
jgi:hypothetical protein